MSDSDSSSSSDSDDGGPRLSAYELQRRATMARNEAYLVSLGLGTVANLRAAEAAARKAARDKRRAEAPPKAPPGPRRTSSRVTGDKPQYTGELIHKSTNEADISRQLRKTSGIASADDLEEDEYTVAQLMGLGTCETTAFTDSRWPSTDKDGSKEQVAGCTTCHWHRHCTFSVKVQVSSLSTLDWPHLSNRPPSPTSALSAPSSRAAVACKPATGRTCSRSLPRT